MMGAIKYLSAFIFLIVGYFSLVSEGIASFSLLILSFVLIPIIELALPENKTATRVNNETGYRLILLLAAPLYIALFVYFLVNFDLSQSGLTIAGHITTMGLLCGIYGINMAHELGHHKNKLDQFVAQLLLASSQYTHFFIEHNRGHHKRVGTPEDPATARRGESVYAFWIRVIRDSYKSAWNLEKERLKRKGKSWLHGSNDMLKYLLLQLGIIVSVGLIFGLYTMLAYLICSLIGIILLETVNYIEHYGLTRKKLNKVAYERVQDIHSWNSDHILGRLLLFELTRHSHHHENSSLIYPRLESKPAASHLPTGYPGMMLLSLVPSLWFKVMDSKLPS